MSLSACVLMITPSNRYTWSPFTKRPSADASSAIAAGLPSSNPMTMCPYKRTPIPSMHPLIEGNEVARERHLHRVQPLRRRKEGELLRR